MLKKILLLFFIILLISGIFGFFLKNKKISRIENNQNNTKNQLIRMENPENTESQLLEIPAETTNIPEVKNLQEENQTENIKPTDTKINDKDSPKIEKKLVNWGFSGSNSRKINTIILHSSYNVLTSDPYDFSDLLKEYRSYGVAPHYVINREGKIYQLVEEKDIAYHAGVSQTPDGKTDVNNFSLGIEIMNQKSDKITAGQYDAINFIISFIKNKYSIKYVLGHNQIAPGRKDDPWNLNWDKIKK